MDMKENRCVACGEILPEGRLVCGRCEKTEPSFDIVKIRVLLNQVTDISKFIRLTSMCQGDVVARSGNFAMNAKSFMGLLSLDLTKPLWVEFYGKVPDEVKEGMKELIVD